MRKQHQTDHNNLYLICRLGLERCRQNLSHVRALMHLGEVREGESALIDAIADLLVSVDVDLRSSVSCLETITG